MNSSADAPLIRESVIFGPPAGAVRDIVPSPNGQFLVVIRGEARTMYSPSLTAADVFHREGDSYRWLGMLPEFSAQIFVHNTGNCVVVRSHSNELSFIRYTASRDGIRENARETLMRAEGLCEPTSMLTAPGDEAIVGVTSRDDGQGWSDPVLTGYWFKVDLRTGAIQEQKQRPYDMPRHGLLGPGVPWAATFDGGDDVALAQRIKALPFRREWAKRVGPSLLLTSARIIDVASGATLLGEEPAGPLRARRVFHDLFPDETLALASDPLGGFELWNIVQQTSLPVPLAPHGETRCAVFLPDRAIVLGLSSGKCALLRF